MYGDQPDLMASMMYSNMAYQQRGVGTAHGQPQQQQQQPPLGYPPQMMGMMQHEMPVGLPMGVGAQPTYLAAKKPVKDKNAPKRNWTAYQFYVEEVRRFSRIIVLSCRYEISTSVISFNILTYIIYLH
jgi:hypothetical protein